jgi:acyl-CoA synthetase (AMP-forming)/AMP-acid ligase II
MRPDMNWFGVLEHHARRTPDKPLAVFGDDVVTFRGMEEWAAAVAAGLHDRGVGAGDVVGLLSYNNLEFLATIFAANHVGAIAMPINWRLAAPELRFILEHSGARALVCDGELVALADDAIDGLGADLARICIAGDAGSTEAREGWERFADLGVDVAPRPRAQAAGDDLHRLMYTSGTTGRPKGVMITHANLAWKNYAHVAEFGFTAEDVGLACGPLYHVGALDLVTTSMIAVGATTVVHRVFDAERVVEEIERSGVTLVWAAPAMVRAILDVPGIEARDLSSVRAIIAGGEKMPIPYIERLRNTFPSAWFADAYGLTETVSGDTFLDRESTVSKLGSVGRPCQYLELDIWDEHGASLPAGERGEVVLRGPKVFKGYWRDPDATSAAFAGGWFHTGDIGVKDEDGYLSIVDRLKDMIVSGGENIASSEVERVLYEHGAVLEAAVVGRADERWGEVPVAYVVLSSTKATTPAELVEHCRRQLAKFKVPKDVVVIDALPRNPSGKVLKRELRDGSS